MFDHGLREHLNLNQSEPPKKRKKARSPDFTDAVGGKGATKERLEKSPIATAPRMLSQGGLVLAYGQHDTEHCALDILLKKGFIEADQYDAGYQLRRLYYSFTATGKWIGEGGKAYDGDTVTERDTAEDQYHRALRSIGDTQDRSVARCVCIEATHVPADYETIQRIQHGLSGLLKHFKNNSCTEE